MLLGRTEGQRRIHELLAHARARRSATLVLVGDPGIGKTALLEYASVHAPDFQIARARGVESEAELPFVGLLDLCRPFLGSLDGLEPPQADLLRATFGLRDEHGATAFAIGAATLSLLAAAAEAQPLLLLVDDAHWLDRGSADALAFAIRRFRADAIAALIATRPAEGRPYSKRDLPELELGGLDETAATELLSPKNGGTLDSASMRAILDLAAGNPLALLELPPEAGAAATGAEPVRLGPRLERAFAGRADALPEATRRALLLMAIADVPDLADLAGCARAGRALAPRPRSRGVGGTGLARRRSASVSPPPGALGHLRDGRPSRSTPCAPGDRLGARGSRSRGLAPCRRRSRTGRRRCRRPRPRCRDGAWPVGLRSRGCGLRAGRPAVRASRRPGATTNGRRRCRLVGRTEPPGTRADRAGSPLRGRPAAPRRPPAHPRHDRALRRRRLTRAPDARGGCEPPRHGRASSGVPVDDGGRGLRPLHGRGRACRGAGRAGRSDRRSRPSRSAVVHVDPAGGVAPARRPPGGGTSVPGAGRLCSPRRGARRGSAQPDLGRPRGLVGWRRQPHGGQCEHGRSPGRVGALRSLPCLGRRWSSGLA